MEANIEEKIHRDHKILAHKGKSTKRRIHGEGERPQRRSEDSKSQTGSWGDRTLVITKGSIWRGKIAINIRCYQHEI